MIKLKKKFLYSLLSTSLAITPISIYAASNYGEALQKAIFFYDIQRLGKINSATGVLTNRVYWRGDSFLQDYALPNDEGTIDLGGGFADAGDNVKFNFPMAASTTILAWSIIEFSSVFETSQQLSAMLANLRWATDYLLKSWDTDKKRLYGQVSPDSVQAEHSNLWMPYEVIDQASIDKKLPRYAFYVDPTHPGTDLAGETVAALAASSIAFKMTDPAYATLLLNAATSLYQTMVDVPNKGRYSENLGRLSAGAWKKADVAPFYNSWSGFEDEISWAATWLYRATLDPNYLATAKANLKLGNLVATQSWDDKSYGTYLLLAKYLPESDAFKSIAKQSAEGWLNAWSQGTDGHFFSKEGLAIASALAPWGNARYAATTAFGALLYDLYFQTTRYQAFAKQQIDYLLGENSKNFSYVEGYGVNFPRHSHHATAQGRWGGNNDVTLKEDNRHIAYGALVGGPKDANDTYVDDRNDYIGNEIALDYNAGLVGALAGLFKEFGGTPLPSQQFPPTRALEKPPLDEIFVNGVIQSSQSGNNQATIQVALLATNHSAWPARVTKNLKLKYFLNLADMPTDGTVKIQPFNTDPRAIVSPLKIYDAQQKIYYVEVWFKDIPIYPGGDERAISSKETQLQFQFSWLHDFSKDWSYQGLGSQNDFRVAVNVPIYEVINGTDKLLYGKEPSAAPRGSLTVNFANSLPLSCQGVTDTLSMGTDKTSFNAGAPFTYSLPLGGPYAVQLASTATPINVSDGTCQGILNTSSVMIPGALTVNYTFKPSPIVDKGNIHLNISTQSDPKCLDAQDQLFLDQDPVGQPFTVNENGLTQTVTLGIHTIKLASNIFIPAPDDTGNCVSTLTPKEVDVKKGVTSEVTATYQYIGSAGGICTIVDSKITQQANWGGQYGIVNTFQIKINLKGALPIALDGTFAMKNDFVQNFWTNFSLKNVATNKNIAMFKGEAWTQEITFGGFILNKSPMILGENPLLSFILNGVTCQST